MEYAVGTSPIYSLSKALLNAYTRVLHSEYNDNNKEEQEVNNMEYAVGTSPIYSLSKALLNAYTRVLHSEYNSNNKEEQEVNNIENKSILKTNLSVFSVCPGMRYLLSVLLFSVYNYKYFY